MKVIRAWVRIKGRRLLYVGEPDCGILTTEDGYRHGEAPVGFVAYGIVTMGDEQVSYADDIEWLPDPVQVTCGGRPWNVRPH